MITVPSVTRANLAVVLVAVLTSCQTPIDSSHWATGRFQGDKVIALNARYDAGSARWRYPPTPTTFDGDNQNLPCFVAGGDTYSTVNFFVPAGSYTATIQAPIRA